MSRCPGKTKTLAFSLMATEHILSNRHDPTQESALTVSQEQVRTWGWSGRQCPLGPT